MSVNAATTVSISPLATSSSSCPLSNLPDMLLISLGCCLADGWRPRACAPRGGKEASRMAFLFGKLAFLVLRPSNLLLLLALAGVLAAGRADDGGASRWSSPPSSC